MTITTELIEWRVAAANRCGCEDCKIILHLLAEIATLRQQTTVQPYSETIVIDDSSPEDWDEYLQNAG